MLQQQHENIEKFTLFLEEMAVSSISKTKTYAAVSNS